MALTFGFYNSMGGDRRYNATQVSALFDGLITDGVFHSIGDIFSTVPGTGLQVVVKSGKAWFNHTWNYNDAPLPFTIAQPDISLARYDAIVLEINSDIAVRANRIRSLTGIAASTPLKPTLVNTETLHQYPLAYIRVPGAATQIQQADIEVVVGKSECPFVTGILTSANIDALFQQWNGQFDEWFDNLKEQLSDDVVGNLQRQIDLLAIPATQEEAEAGTVTAIRAWSPQRVKQAIKTNSAITDWKLLSSYKKAGTYQWKAPDIYGDGQSYEIGVFLIGGGSSGRGQRYVLSSAGAGSYYGMVGGASGYTNVKIQRVVPGESYSLVVGQGGVALPGTSALSTGSTIAVNGAATSFDGVVALGAVGDVGGQDATPMTNSYSNVPDNAPCLGTFPNYSTASGLVYITTNPLSSFNPFDNKRYLGAGGYSYITWDGMGGNPTKYNGIRSFGQKAPVLPDGLKAGDGSAIWGYEAMGPVVGKSATSPGGGGGAVVSFVYSDITPPAANSFVTAGSGADGAVFIYARYPVDVPFPTDKKATIKVEDQWGRAMKSVPIIGLTNLDGNISITDVNGYATGYLETEGIITLPGDLYVDMPEKTFNVLSMFPTLQNIVLVWPSISNNTVFNFKDTQNIKFYSCELDMCLIGGGGGGGGATWTTPNNVSGGGGGAGGMQNIFNVTPSKNVELPLVIGSGGAGGLSPSSGQTTGYTGTDGSNTTFLGYAATGGKGGVGAQSSGTGGAGGIAGTSSSGVMGNGGKGRDQSASNAAAGVAATSRPFNDSSFPIAFGGGGGGGGQSSPGGLPGGGRGGALSTGADQAMPGMLYGSGGGGGGGAVSGSAGRKGGDGYQGFAILRIRPKS